MPLRPEVTDLLDRIRLFLREEVHPLEPDFLRGDLAAVAPALAGKRQRAQALGLWTPHLPPAYGGLGLSLWEFGHVSELLGRSPLGHYLCNCQAPDIGNMELLLHFGSEEQKERWLLPLAAGEIRSCFSMTEPENPGSNPVMMSTTALPEGEDYVINGRKWFTTAADGAAFAIVMAITNPDADRYARASQIIVPTDTPGFRLAANTPVMGHVGSGFATHGEVEYVDCRVPQSYRIGAEGAGFALAQERLGPGRIHHCMRWIGVCERAFETLCRHVVQRKIDPDKTLATRQIVQAWIAEARAEIDAARLMVLHAAWTIDRKGFAAAREQVSLIKFYVADVMMRVIDRAIQLHGALGVTSDTVLGFYYVHERGARIYDGPDEVHKMVVAKRILARYQGGA